MNNVIDIVADLDLDTLQNQLAIRDTEYAACNAELERLETEEREAKAMLPVLMALASTCQKELTALEGSVYQEIAALGEATDIAGHGFALSKMRAKASVLNGAIQYHAETALQGLRLRVMTARIAKVRAEALQVEAETLTAAKKLATTLLPALEDQGQVEIVSERLESLVRHSALLWEKVGFLTAELKTEVARQEKARTLRASTGGPITRGNFVQ